MELHLLQTTNLPTLKVAVICGLSYGTCRRIKRLHTSLNTAALRKLLNPGMNRAGAVAHLSVEQATMISERLIYAGKRGFAADVNDLKSLMAQTACLNDRPYKNGLPSDDTVRLYRAKHRERALPPKL